MGSLQDAVPTQGMAYTVDTRQIQGLYECHHVVPEIPPVENRVFAALAVATMIQRDDVVAIQMLDDAAPTVSV